MLRLSQDEDHIPHLLRRHSTGSNCGIRQMRIVPKTPRHKRMSITEKGADMKDVLSAIRHLGSIDANPDRSQR